MAVLISGTAAEAAVVCVGLDGHVDLACISHHVSAATGDLQHAAAFPPIRLLDVLSSTTPRSSGQKRHIAQHLTGFATRRGEICRPQIVTTGCCSVDLGDPAEPSAATSATATDSCAGCVDLGLDVESLKAAKELLPGSGETASRRLISAGSPDRFGIAGTQPSADHDWVFDLLSSVILLT